MNERSIVYKILALGTMILPLGLTGCWDSTEINQRHVVLEMGIDKCIENKTNDLGQITPYQVIYSIPDIAKLSGGDSLSEAVKTVFCIESPTLATSIDEIETKTQNTITFGHTKTILFGEEILKDKMLLKGALDALVRDMEMGRNITVLATNKNTKQMIETSNPENPIMGLYIMKYFNNRERPTSYAKEQWLGNMITELETSGVTILPVIISDSASHFQISGGALLKDYTLVDYLSKEEIRGQLFVEGAIKDVPIVIQDGPRSISYLIKEQKSKVKFKKLHGELGAYIEIETTGDITDTPYLQKDMIVSKQQEELLKKKFEQEIEKQVRVSVDKSKKLNTDYLNIGLTMYRKHPKEWKKYETRWKNHGYQTFPVTVNVKVTIENIGTTQ